MTLKDQISQFTSHLEAQSFSPRTVEAYTRHAREFAAFLDRYYPRVSKPNEVTREIVDDYQRFVRDSKTRDGRPPANATIRLKLTAVKIFFAFLAKQDLVLRDPTTVIVAPKEQQRLTRRVPTDDEMRDVLNAVQPRNPESMRDRAILELFYACGMRTSELCNLKISEVDLKDQTATIVAGKGNKTRIVPIGQYAAYYIGLYLEKARKRLLRGKKEDPGNLFLTSTGRPFSRQTINRSVMGRVNKLVDGEKRITCYSLRHAAATTLIAHGVDIAYVAQLLGHESLETTQRYLKIEIGDLKRMHSLYHPREQDHRGAPA